MQKKEYTGETGRKPLIAQITDLADQADGSVILRQGNTVVLATAVMGSRQRSDIDYFPLTVDFEEKFYAAGQILGSRFVRREGRPSEEAVLSGRVVDRTIRPLFEHHIRTDVHVVVTVLSIDEEDPDVLGVIAASLALGISDIPWNGPVSAVRIGKLKGSDEFIINPTYSERAHADFELDLLACGKDGVINMIEVGGSEVPEATVGAALTKAGEEIERIQAFQDDIIREIGKEKKLFPKPETPQELVAFFDEHFTPRMPEALFPGTAGKSSIGPLKGEWMDQVREQFPDMNPGMQSDYFENKIDALLHEKALREEKRPDGRGMNELRDLFAQAGNVSPILHGSGIFYRGGTHVFSALTLGGPGEAMIIDSMEEQEGEKRFMHHYNFPPFSSGETGRMGGFNRRQIGHGALAEKALEPVIPEKESFPYTIRLVSESMASNGSTSMGSVCASTLALMDGGVPIKNPVAGIAMGLMMAAPAEGGRGSAPGANDAQYKILTDIQGPEDHHGDMDFKVAGTREGVTAIQMDVKVDGVPIPILEEALRHAKEARLHILDVMLKEIPSPRADISPRAPKIITITVPVDQIGGVIGPGGKTIRRIKEESGVEDIVIEDDGSVFITGKNGTAEIAAKTVADMTRTYEAGEKFEGEVTRIVTFGAFVKIGAKAEGLVHISEIAPFRINNVADALSIGETVPVIIKEIDDQGRINLSIKTVDPDFAKKKGIEPSADNNRNNHAPRGETGYKRNEHGHAEHKRA